MLKYLLEKEFKMIFRNSFIPKMIIMMPLASMLIFPWAMTMEVKDIRITVVDKDGSNMSREVVRKIDASSYFDMERVVKEYPQALQDIEKDKADVILEIPQDFQKELTFKGVSAIGIYANSVNGLKGGLSVNYLSGILSDFTADLQTQLYPDTPQEEGIHLWSMFRFNRKLDYKVFMVPAIVVLVLSLLCGFLPTFNIVSEKEAGSMEQLNVTPVKKSYFIISKLIPYWIIAFVVITICFLLAYWVYDLIPPSGNYGAIYIGVTLFGLSLSGAGLVISNKSETMQQALFVIYFFMMVFILMSGLFTPVESMPQWAQNITIFNPLKYFIRIMRMAFLKGSTVIDLIPDYLALLCFDLFFITWAIVSYKKRN